jgi:tetratricopeptide (TPR) repeat protein
MMSNAEAHNLHTQGINHYRAGRYADAAHAFEQAQAAAQTAGDRRQAAEALNDLGVARRELREWDAAQAALEAARTLFVELQDIKGQAQAIGNLASVYDGRGDHPAAAEAYRESARMFEENGDSELAMYSWQALSRLHLDQKDWIPAIAAYEEGIDAMPDGSLKKGMLQRLVRLPGKWLLGE